MRDYLADHYAASAARTSNTAAVALRIVATLTKRGMPFPPMTEIAATVHDVARAPRPTETVE